MITLLDKERENNAIRKKRQENIKNLTVLLEEAKMLRLVIRGKSFEEQQERLEVKREIDRLERFIESEKKAIEGLDTPDDESIKKFLQY